MCACPKLLHCCQTGGAPLVSLNIWGRKFNLFMKVSSSPKRFTTPLHNFGLFAKWGTPMSIFLKENQQCTRTHVHTHKYNVTHTHMYTHKHTNTHVYTCMHLWDFSRSWRILPSRTILMMYTQTISHTHPCPRTHRWNTHPHTHVHVRCLSRHLSMDLTRGMVDLNIVRIAKTRVTCVISNTKLYYKKKSSKRENLEIKKGIETLVQEGIYKEIRRRGTQPQSLPALSTDQWGSKFWCTLPSG